MGNPSLSCFLIRLASLRLPTEKYLDMSKNEIIKKMKIGKSTFYKYYEASLKEGYIKLVDGKIELSTDIFPVFNPKQVISDKSRARINSILMDSPESRERKTLLTYYNPQTDEFTGLKGSIDDFLDFCISGVPKHSKNPIKETTMKFN